MNKTTVFLAALLLTGCSPDLSGSWDFDFEVGGDSYGGEMYLDESGDDVSGDFSMDVENGCERFEGDVEGEFDRKRDEVELVVELDNWTCGDTTYEVYDIELTLDVIKDGPFEISGLIGDGDWAGDDVDFEASR